MGEERAIRLEGAGLCFRRGDKTILDDVSVTFDRPGLVAVIGPNGAGKSTLLAMLAGLLKPDAGEARLDDRPVLEIKPKELARIRAYLPQNARCEWPIATERVVALGLTPMLPALGDLAAGDKARVEAALTAFDLEAVRAQTATTLSGGELARAMLARAMVGEPRILIADEPTTGLDPRHAMDAMRRLKAVGASGRLVLASIHDLALAARYADRVVAIKDGRVFAAGEARETLTADCLRGLFDVEAEVEAGADGLTIRFVGR
jgi:iron complex transport system ATP-binding protein